MPDFWDMGDDDNDDAPGEHGGAMPEEGSSVVPSNKNLGNYRYTPFIPLIFLTIMILTHRQETYRGFIHIHGRTEAAIEWEL